MAIVKKILIDPERCSNCGDCELVCSMHLTGEINPSKSAIRVTRWYEEGIFAPMLCLQCTDPPCVMVCPVTALHRSDETGLVYVDYDTCIGCGLCAIVCPFGGIMINVEQKKIAKCDLCNGEPEILCTKFCERKAIQVVPADELYFIKMRNAATRLKDLIAKHVTVPS